MFVKGLLLLITMTCLMYSTISTREISDPNEEIFDPADEKHVVGCLSAIVKFKPCIGEIIHCLKTGKLDTSPECCRKIILIAQLCWPKMNLNMKTTSICGLPTSYSKNVQAGDGN